MQFRFSDYKPTVLSGNIPLISGENSVIYNGVEYLIAESAKGEICAYEIRYKYSCSPFNQAAIIDDKILLAGFEGYFYMYDINANENLLALKMFGYFGNFTLHNNLIFVADAGSLHCIDKSGKIIWANRNLGIDGVLINDFSDDKIYGYGEWDPPGGWQDFVLDINTGEAIS